MGRAAYLIDNRYQAPSRRGTLKERRLSRMDVWNREIVDAGPHGSRARATVICGGTRRFVTTAGCDPLTDSRSARSEPGY